MIFLVGYICNYSAGYVSLRTANSYKPSHGIDWFQNKSLPDYE